MANYYPNEQLSPEHEELIERERISRIRLEAVEQLRELTDQLYETLDEMRRVIQEAKPSALNTAESYWLAHIDGALENRGSYLGGSFISLEDTIKDLEEEEGEEE